MPGVGLPVQIPCIILVNMNVEIVIPFNGMNCCAMFKTRLLLKSRPLEVHHGVWIVAVTIGNGEPVKTRLHNNGGNGEVHLKDD